MLEASSNPNPRPRPRLRPHPHPHAHPHQVHLSDFIVLHLLRQGKTSLETLGLLKSQFVALDRDRSGSLAAVSK